MEKTKTVAWLMIIAIVLLVTIIAIQLSTKETLVTSDGKTAVITKTNFLKKS
ncbi:MAG: hypothetical protein PHX80_05510 [Candidatus Nanoarchaeia archaeon]|nr:hypothetical protein [Candidatus Nanoarchaeia archaeon]